MGTRLATFNDALEQVVCSIQEKIVSKSYDSPRDSSDDSSFSRDSLQKTVITVQSFRYKLKKEIHTNQTYLECSSANTKDQSQAEESITKVVLHITDNVRDTGLSDVSQLDQDLNPNSSQYLTVFEKLIIDSPSLQLLPEKGNGSKAKKNFG